MAAHKKTFTWEDAQKISADMFFDIYGDRSDRNWARIIWKSLERRGLADYTGPEEKHRILLRLMTLGVICHEFCYVAWKDGEYPPLADWADAMGMDPALVIRTPGGGLAGQLNLEKDEEDAVYDEALKEAVEHVRVEMFRLMVDMFGGKTFLFASLWKMGQSGYPDTPPEKNTGAVRDWDQWRNDDLLRGEAEFSKTVTDVLDEADPEKREAFEWVDGGMPAVWW
jgi:hypothetical protein